MQFKKKVLERIANGEVDLAFRRWRRPTARSGGRLTTAVGVLAFDEVVEVRAQDVTDAEARRAGFESVDELLADVRDGADRRLYRVTVRSVGPDPRAALRERDDVDDAELDRLTATLDRMDARGRCGPWTAAVLAVIDRRPATRAGDLADELGRDTDRLKLDVRKLKNLGLTESLGTGYRLSPRGRRVLGHLRGSGPDGTGWSSIGRG